MLKRDPDAKHPRYFVMNRRQFLVKAIPMAAGAALLAACSGSTEPQAKPTAANTTPVPPLAASDLPKAMAYADPFSNVATDELGRQVKYV